VNRTLETDLGPIHQPNGRGIRVFSSFQVLFNGVR
jgi:hypothetical protein